TAHTAAWRRAARPAAGRSDGRSGQRSSSLSLTFVEVVESTPRHRGVQPDAPVRRRDFRTPSSVQALMPQERVDAWLAPAKRLETFERGAAATGLEHVLAIAPAGRHVER